MQTSTYKTRARSVDQNHVHKNSGVPEQSHLNVLFTQSAVLLRGQSLYYELVHPHFQSTHPSQHLHIVQVLQSVSPFSRRTKTDSKSSNSSGIVCKRHLNSVHQRLEYQQLSVDNTFRCVRSPTMAFASNIDHHHNTLGHIAHTPNWPLSVSLSRSSFTISSLRLSRSSTSQFAAMKRPLRNLAFS
jgi:hypothetical protein